MSNVQCDYWGTPTPSESEIVESKLRKEIRKNTEYICRQLGIKTPWEAEREQWELDNFYDKETKTTRSCRINGLIANKAPLCCNECGKVVNTIHLQDVQEYIVKHSQEFDSELVNYAISKYNRRLQANELRHLI